MWRKRADSRRVIVAGDRNAAESTAGVVEGADLSWGDGGVVLLTEEKNGVEERK